MCFAGAGVERVERTKTFFLRHEEAVRSGTPGVLEEEEVPGVSLRRPSRTRLNLLHSLTSSSLPVVNNDELQRQYNLIAYVLSFCYTDVRKG